MKTRKIHSKEVDSHLDLIFQSAKYITFDDFKRIITEEACDMYLGVSMITFMFSYYCCSSSAFRVQTSLRK
jgi:hypothetical protein